MAAPTQPDHRHSLPDFSNTEQAYAHLSSGELSKSFWLFRLVGSSTLVRLGKHAMQWALALRIPVGWIIRPTVYSQFCGGESIGESEETVAKLATSKVHTILDYSAEGKELESELDNTADEILTAIRATRNDERHAFGVFKVTGIAPTAILEAVSAGKPLDEHGAKEWERVANRVAALCSEAAAVQTPIFIDAEETWMQPAIDELAEQQMRIHNQHEAIVYQTIQLYRLDRLAYLKDLTARAESQGFRLGVKLVRGAYMEKERLRASEKGVPSPIQPSKMETDRDYDAALCWCVDHLDRLSLCAGSHNEASNELLCQLMADRKINPSDRRIWFAQLLGMSDPISFNLASAGYNVAKYVPYGPIRETIPYLIRRAEENSATAGQSSRELELIRKEVSRRKQEK